ncbi:glycosyltransferase family 4 protein [Acidihalobacter aeolianus]|uniref:glycosyltransferase family 4 protein n=1 Tax=Acidihalobacter aeolianus TaxID=2792603 RepID=UPI0018D3F58A|nr:glycosyltransferase family 1 protein [Acidihalobacter aeolianus]
MAGLPEIELSGLLQMSKRMTLGGVTPHQKMSVAEQVHRYSRTVVSLKGSASVDWKAGLAGFIEEQVEHWRLRLAAYFGVGAVGLKQFETKFFEDFIWQTLFARSVPSEERERILACDHRVCASPWRWMHLAGIERKSLMRASGYPKLDAAEFDLFIAQTPYPARLSGKTKLVVHYHDAIPVLMPHTISDRAFHEASHFNALAANVRDGAHFVCVSEATRQDLLSLFPEAEPRSVTIHNMLPAHYYPSEPEPERLAGIMRRYQIGEFKPPLSKKNDRVYRLSRQFGGEADKTAFYEQTFNPQTRFLLMVSTIEPRKNHRRLLEAWEVLRDRLDKDIKLVFVGHIGCDYKDLLPACETWIEQGGLFMLQNVPADALRVLYRQALVTVCPSVGEGFDFSGVEAMRCGGVVAASDIPVHREVYGDAAAYFNPYDTGSLVAALQNMAFSVDADAQLAALREQGQLQSSCYLPEKVLPQWADFLGKISSAD